MKSLVIISLVMAATSALAGNSSSGGSFLSKEDKVLGAGSISTSVGPVLPSEILSRIKVITEANLDPVAFEEKAEEATETGTIKLEGSDFEVQSLSDDSISATKDDLLLIVQPQGK